MADGETQEILELKPGHLFRRGQYLMYFAGDCKRLRSDGCLSGVICVFSADRIPPYAYGLGCSERDMDLAMRELSEVSDD